MKTPPLFSTFAHKFWEGARHKMSPYEPSPGRFAARPLPEGEGRNEAMLLDLLNDQSTLSRARLHYFLINKGPWRDLDMNEPFVPGAPAAYRRALEISDSMQRGIRLRKGD